MDNLQFSSGSQHLDQLLEELRIGDNVVFSVSDPQAYKPFVALLKDRAAGASPRIIYARSNGMLDSVMGDWPNVQVLNLVALAGDDLLDALECSMREIGRGVHYVFDPLDSLAPTFCSSEDLGYLFKRMCPLLYALDTVAYWVLLRSKHSDKLIADVKDCTQVFLEVRESAGEFILTPLKVAGRYSERMFRPHQILDRTSFTLKALAVGSGDQQNYARILEDKNRELIEIRDALDASNQELQARNQSLAEQQERTRTLTNMLSDVLALLQMGQEIASSLVLEQVRQTGIEAAQRLFKASQVSLVLNDDDLDIADQMSLLDVEDQALQEFRQLLQEAGNCRQVCSATLDGGRSVAVAPFLSRGKTAGFLVIVAPDMQLDRAENRAWLEYLSSVIGVAIDNARLYAELEEQGEQLRSWVERVISQEETNSRQFALDLHDGLLQLIVAAYQHLQSARAWQDRNPERQTAEAELGSRLVRDAIHESRRLIAQLRPAGLDDFGLLHALRLFFTQQMQDTGLAVDAEFSADWPTLPVSLEAAIFRIVQEAMTNVLKHAQAERVSVQLYRDESLLCIEVIDHGQGFDVGKVVAKPERGLHIGLVGIRERARLWDGSCTVDSELGRGTRIFVTIPMPEDRGDGS